MTAKTAITDLQFLFSMHPDDGRYCWYSPSLDKYLLRMPFRGTVTFITPEQAEELSDEHAFGDDEHDAVEAKYGEDYSDVPLHEQWAAVHDALGSTK